MSLVFVFHRAPEGNLGLMPVKDYVGHLRFIADHIEKVTRGVPYSFVQVDENYAVSTIPFQSFETLPEGFPEESKEVMRELLSRFEKDVS